MSEGQVRYRRERKRIGKVGVPTKIFQGIGALPDSLKGFAFGTFLLFYYSQILGLPASLASSAIAFALIVDALFDPLVGSFSDHLKTRLGRRHLLMYLSAAPLGLSLFLVFTPPQGVSQNILAAWLLLTTIAANMSMSVFLIPWSALYAEFSDDYSERTTIVTYRYAMGWIGSLIFIYTTWTYLFPSSHAYDPGQLNPHGYRMFALVLAAAVVLTVLVTTHLTRREVPYLLQPINPTPRLNVFRVIREIGSTLSNREFLILFSGALLTAGISGTTGALGIYVQTYFWGLRPENLRWFTLAFVGALLAFVLVGPIERLLDKKTVLLTCFGLLLVDGIAMIGFRLLDVLPNNGDPRLLILLISNEVGRVFLGTILGIMFASMLADTLDVQELRTGRRQEGMFAAALSFSGKATGGVGSLVAGVLLQWVIRWPVKVSPHDVPHEAVMRLGTVAGMLVPFLFIIPFILGLRYRITRRVHEQTRAQLALQRSEQDTSDVQSVVANAARFDPSGHIIRELGP